MALTGRRKRFVEEYLVDLFGSKAARRAGFAPEFAARQAYKLMQDPEIVEAIQVANEERAARTRASADRVVHELVGLAHSNVLAALDVNEDTGEVAIDLRNLTPDQAAAIASIETETRTETVDGKPVVIKTVKLKFHPKTAALARLAEHLGVGTKDWSSAGDIADDQDPPVAPE